MLNNKLNFKHIIAQKQIALKKKTTIASMHM